MTTGKPEPAHSPDSVLVEELFEDVPPPQDFSHDLLRGLVLRSDRRVLALDDDPTGTQTVSDVPLILSWSEEDIRWALRQPSPLSVIVTNTRSLSVEKALEVATDVASNAAAATRYQEVEVSLISRGDSTLRGHTPLEIGVLMEVWRETLQVAHDAMLLCPAYVEAGRITVNGVHYVVSDSRATPVGESEFARDATFGYHSSRLTDWIAEKAPGRFDLSKAVPIHLEDIRRGGVNAIVERLMSVAGGQLVVIDAAAASDLDIMAAAVVQAESMGKRFACQCGPSFLRARAGQPPRGPLPLGHVLQRGKTVGGHGLVVVGSHVGLTNDQLERAKDLGGLSEIILDATSLIDPDKSDAEIARAVHAALDAIVERDVIISTSREVLKGEDGIESLAISGMISAAVVKTVREIVDTGPPLRFLVTKGGITSCDVLREAVGFVRGWVVGQILNGMVSVWLPASTQYLKRQDEDMPAFPLVVFAGNVGGLNGLGIVIGLLRDL